VYDLGSKRIFCPSDVIIDEAMRNTVSEGIAEEDERKIQLPEVREKGVAEITPENLAEQDSYVATRNKPDLEGFGGDTIIVRPPHHDDESRGRIVSLPGLRRSERQRNPSQHTNSQVPRAMIAHLDEPHILKEALASDDTDKWYKAWESEVDSLVRNKMWELSPLPPGREAIGCQWLFKLKEDGRYKVRLVAKGYSRQAGLDYTETFAQVAKFTSLRSLLALVAENDWEREGRDVKTAFLHSDLEETVFIQTAEGLHMDMPVSDSQKEDRIVCCLNKAIYVLKQSPRTWYRKISKLFNDHGFQRSEHDHNIYIHKTFKLILLLYVDDLVITSPNQEDISWIQDLLHTEFEMTDLGPLATFLRIEIRRSLRNRCLHLSQAQYVKMILERHGMTDSGPIRTPADPPVRLLKSSLEHQADANNPQRYQSAVGSLMYAMVASRPDIAFAVSAVSQHSTNPGPAPWMAVRRIFRYLARTQTWGLNYQAGDCQGYTDAD